MESKEVLDLYKPKAKKAHYKPLEAILLFGVIILFCIFVIVPFMILISGSLSDSELIGKTGVWFFPKGFSLDAYKVVFAYPGDMLKSYLISVIVTVGGVILNLLLVCPVAYAISKKEFIYGKAVTLFFVFTIMFNGGFVSNYILFRNYLHIFDTLWVLILPPAGMVGHMILLKVFYSALPPSLYESACIDGASEFRTFLRIATPLIIPGIATAAFYSVLFYWNDPQSAMLYADNLIPVSLYLTRITQYIEFLKYAQQNGFAGMDLSNMVIPEQTLVYAIAVATTAPMLCIFTVFQKYFVSGLTAGSVKG